MARHQSPERIQLIFGGPPPAVVFHSMYTTPAFELCEDIIHSGPSEREMRHTRNAHNRSDYMSEVNNNFNNLKPKCACRDTATDTPKRSVEKDPNDNEWEYGDGDQSPMDQKVFFSQFGKYIIHICTLLANGWLFVVMREMHYIFSSVHGPTIGHSQLGG